MTPTPGTCTCGDGGTGCSTRCAPKGQGGICALDTLAHVSELTLCLCESESLGPSAPRVPWQPCGAWHCSLGPALPRELGLPSLGAAQHQGCNAGQVVMSPGDVHVTGHLFRV